MVYFQNKFGKEKLERYAKLKKWSDLHLKIKVICPFSHAAFITSTQHKHPVYTHPMAEFMICFSMQFKNIFLFELN